MKKPLVLCIMDGYGIKDVYGNAIAAASKPNLDKFFAENAYTTIGASGMAVGLPDGQMGNSEVGHTNMGAGRIVYQELTRITKSIKDGNFFDNEALKGAMENCKANGSALHLMGLMSDGGVHSHITHLYAIVEMAKKYGLSDTPVLLYAMGDGNHSLATAKEFYEQLKKANPDKDLSNHPARYALAEIVNLHSNALKFEAIHRLVYDVDCDKLISELTSALDLSETKESDQYVICSCCGTEKKLYINKKSSNLSVGSLQNFLDGYIKANGGKIDYIHGADTVKSLAEKHNGISFVLPDMDKSQLFPTVIKDGALPRKTFSMGHAEDKRFYIEARKITE